MAEGGADIEQAIRVILGTAPGERPMRPGFGCRIHELVFSPLSTSTGSLAAHYVEEALGWWEPRIEVTDVAVTPDADNSARLLINVHYEIKTTHDERSLVYPFYLIPEE